MRILNLLRPKLSQECRFYFLQKYHGSVTWGLFITHAHHYDVVLVNEIEIVAKWHEDDKVCLLIKIVSFF